MQADARGPGDVLVRRLLAVVASLLPVLLLGTASESAVPPEPYRLLQLNLCLSGLGGCYAGTEYPAVVEEAIARITAAQPDVVTLNETCSGDVERIAASTQRSYRFVAVAYQGAPLPCVRPGGRGLFGNALLTTAQITASQDRAFATQSDAPSDPEERRWLCVVTADDVRACTTHLGVTGTPAGVAANDAQCAELAAVLADGGSHRATVFAGDLNRQQSCARQDFWTLQDGAARQAAGIQHAYGSRGSLLQPEAEVLPMAYTDHDGLLVHARLEAPRAASHAQTPAGAKRREIVERRMCDHLVPPRAAGWWHDRRTAT